MRAVPLQIARWVPGDYRVLGADGFGFADTRPAARRFFHIDAQSVVVQALQALADAGEIDRGQVEKAFARVPHRRPDRRLRRQAGGRRRLTRSSDGSARRVASFASVAVGPDSPATGESASGGGVPDGSDRADRGAAAGLEQAAEAGAGVRRRLGGADELVHDPGEPLRVVLVREVAGVRDHLDAGVGGEGGGVVGVPDRDHPVVAAPDHRHRHRLGEVGAVGHRDDLAAPVDDRADHVPDRRRGRTGP